jgi:hypothetical protein
MRLGDGLLGDRQIGDGLLELARVRDGDVGAYGTEIHADRPWLHNAPLWLADRAVV